MPYDSRGITPVKSSVGVDSVEGTTAKKAYNRVMADIAALYQQFDPGRPLEADETDLYVNWQAKAAPDDVKTLLVRSIAMSGDIPVTRLITGHRGSGKTTELKRVKQIFETDDRKVFVSFLEAQEWLNLQDVEAEDIALHMVRQLVADLSAAGCSLALAKVIQAFEEFKKVLQASVELSDFKFSAAGVGVGLKVKDVPGAQGKLRELLGKRLPTLHQLINEEILVEARKCLLQKGYQDILVIVDDLDKIPERQTTDRRVTNHVVMFIEQAASLRSLKCDVLLTVPIELAYSKRGQELGFIYGGDLHSLPVIPVASKNGDPYRPGLAALRTIVEDRAKKAGLSLAEIFRGDADLDRLCSVSGGHLRSLFILLRSSMEHCGSLPLTESAIELTIRKKAHETARPLKTADWKILRKVHKTKSSSDSELFFDLLRSLFIFSYTDEGGKIWYDWNPLLGLVTAKGAGS
jgi:hypothetical protein